jgi:hypothetical protein
VCKLTTVTDASIYTAHTRGIACTQIWTSVGWRRCSPFIATSGSGCRTVTYIARVGAARDFCLRRLCTSANTFALLYLLYTCYFPVLYTCSHTYYVLILKRLAFLTETYISWHYYLCAPALGEHPVSDTCTHTLCSHTSFFLTHPFFF